MRIYRFLEKITIKKVYFSQFLKDPLQLIKITLHSMGYMGINCFAKNTTFTVFRRFRKKQLILRVLVRSLKKSILYVTNVKKNKISRILKLPSWQHWYTYALYI